MGSVEISRGEPKLHIPVHPWPEQPKESGWVVLRYPTGSQQMAAHSRNPKGLTEPLGGQKRRQQWGQSQCLGESLAEASGVAVKPG